MPATQPIGIDLGTTYSAVACLDQAGHSKMIANAAGENLTPSAVLFAENLTIVGKEANKAGILQPDRLAQCVKRDMGAAVYSQAVGGKYLPPEVIQACILRQLKQDIERTVGPDTAVVITVPAFFDEPRRKATSDAGEMAGLKFLDIVNEPTAAALAFGEELGYLAAGGAACEPLTLLVYDLGGGTFDVTIIRLKPGDLRTLATDGDVHLGGHDWDRRLAGYVADAFVHEHRDDPRDNPTGWQRLLNEVEEAKRTLTARQQTQIRVEHAGKSTTVPVTRELFEDLTADLLERTAHTTRQVLKDGSVGWSDIDRVLLVGGSSRMPMVAAMIERLSGKTPSRSVNPDEAVARGAAIYAGYLLKKRGLADPATQFEVTDVNSHSLGIEGVDPQTGSRRNAVLIPRNTPLPVSKTREFVTHVDNQNSIALRVLEGESVSPEDCTPIGRTVIDQLPPALPRGWPIKVSYHYDTNGRLSVRALVPGTDREVQLEIERERGMGGERIEQWKKAIAAEAGLESFEPLIPAEVTPSPAPQPPNLSGDQDLAETTSPFPVDALQQQLSAFETENYTALSNEMLEESELIPETAISGGDEGLTVSRGAMPVDLVVDNVVAPDYDQHTFADSPADLSNHRIRSRRTQGTLAYLAGHLIFSILGLVIGYYLLCWLSPESNFLDIRLPGLHN